MRLLLDTHTFLFVFGDPNLSSLARMLIEDINNDKYLSLGSIWEISIKVRTTRLTIGQPLDAFFKQQTQQNGFLLLPIESHHATGVATLPFHHRDPFDRLLVSQCLAEGMPLISIDAKLDPYGIRRLW